MAQWRSRWKISIRPKRISATRPTRPCHSQSEAFFQRLQADFRRFSFGAYGATKPRIHGGCPRPPSAPGVPGRTVNRRRRMMRTVTTVFIDPEYWSDDLPRALDGP